MCGNPAYAEMRFNPAKGVLSESFDVPVEKARADDGVCGPEAVLFEPQIVPVVAGRAIVKGGWIAFQVAGFSAAGLLFLSWLLR